MLLAVPALNWVIEMTLESKGSTLREVMVCKAVTICAPTMTGSMQRCGIAPWPPLPSIVIVISSAAAISGPLRIANEPTGEPGQLCMP